MSNVRLLPPSLFGRLTLLLVVLLAAAQLISAAAHFYDHNRTMLQTAGVNTAERIAGIARLLDSLEPAARRRAVQALDVSPLRVALTEWRTLPQGQRQAAAVALAGLLRRHLGDGIDLAVAVRDGGEAPAGPMAGPPWDAGMHRHMAPWFAPPYAPASYLVQLRLHDGQSVLFDYRLPADLFAWRWRLVASLAVLLLSAGFIAWLAVRWIIRPLAVLARAADDLGRDIDRPPLSEEGPSEVATAARAFNRMQRRIARYLSDRARVLAAVSHDLKTPITRLRLRAAMLDDEAQQAKIQADLDEMEAMVTDSLEFLRGMESSEATRPIDLMALLESIQGEAEEAGRRIDLRGGGAPYRGRVLALKRCLNNLVQNALRYGEQVAIVLTDTKEAVRIDVEDDGPGIDESLLEQVFEPFYRIDNSRNRRTGGSGLGLAIARNIARAHGGNVQLARRPEGGLRATVTLPR